MKFDEALEKLIIGTAKAQGIDPELGKRLVWQESRGNPKAKSPKGAMGLTQLMPGTAQDLGVKDPWDPEQNLSGGFKYLSQQIKSFDDLGKALAAYNAGPGNVKKHGGIPPFKETQNYVSSILSGYKKPDLEGTMVPDLNPQAKMGGIQEILQMMQPQKPSKLQAIGDIMTSLAPVAASFHSPEAQAQATAQSMNVFAQRDAAQKSKVAEMLQMMKLGQPDFTDDQKEYQAVVEQYRAMGKEPPNFYDYMQTIKRPPGENIPAIEEIMNLMAEKVKRKLGGGQAPQGEDTVIDLGSI